MGKYYSQIILRGKVHFYLHKVIIFFAQAQQEEKISIDFHCLAISKKLMIFRITISVPGLPIDHVNEKKFYGAAAVTSESGQGAIIQHMEYFYELKCNTSGCSWTILPQQLSPGVRLAVMMTLPPNYTC